jgi:hypothetical protein
MEGKRGTGSSTANEAVKLHKEKCIWELILVPNVIKLKRKCRKIGF